MVASMRCDPVGLNVAATGKAGIMSAIWAELLPSQETWSVPSNSTGFARERYFAEERPPSIPTVGSSVQCRINVGTGIGRMPAMLVSLFIRITVLTAEGLPPRLSHRSHQR